MIYQATERLRLSRDRAKNWMLQQVGPNGEPADWHNGNGWSRFPWTFALLGETTAGAAVLEWVTRHGLEAALHKGRFSAYPIAHLAMGALLLERHDIAARLFDVLAVLQDEATGGMPIELPGGEFAGLSDLLSTSQAGMAALLGGRMDMAERARNWVMACLLEQPHLPGVLYTARSAQGLVVDPPASLKWMLEVRCGEARQAYFFPGIAAAFLALYAMRIGDDASLTAGHRYLEINTAGSAAQFDDLASVQACKFGWGVALMQIADPTRDYSNVLVRMADWFVARQREDGSWTPSSFLSAHPTRVELMTKTAEHAMEATAILAALAVIGARA